MWLIWLTALFAIASAGYSAFLFAQARGRDFWQSPLLFWHLIVQAIAAGAAVLILIGALEFVTPYQFISPQLFAWLVRVLSISLLASLAMICSDLFMKHGAEDAVRAAALLLTGPLRNSFWLLAIGLGVIVPMVADSLVLRFDPADCYGGILGAVRPVDVRAPLDQGRPGFAAELEGFEKMADSRQPLNPDALRLEPAQGGLASYPPVDKWDDWVEYDTATWPRKVEKHCRIIPTICFNCEAACGLVAVVEKDTNRIRRFEGNPEHPGSRGRNCAKGPATLNQVTDPERIRYPLKRIGKRGEGKWERVSWDEVLDDIAGRVRNALQEDRRNEIMYHVGRPGHELLYHQRIFHAWGIDGHNSHTNVCSAGARAGYAFWSGIDRPSPDHANARFMLLLSSHLETGHYFNPHAQRIIEGKERGAKICVIDTRLSNTASKADYWISSWPGSEAAILLAMCNLILQEDLFDREFVRQWVNWEEYLREEFPTARRRFKASLRS